MRYPGGSDYSIAKHAINRLVEYVTLEYPAVPTFSLHPGVIDTELSHKTGLEFTRPDTTELPAAVALYLTSGKADWLSGR
jgi:NAD(P)-dependent dehydrogenase (short-subunit alcohol dehydrogenase family)